MRTGNPGLGVAASANAESSVGCNQRKADPFRASHRRLLLAWLCFHLILIVSVGVHDTFWLLQRRIATVSGVRPAVWKTLDTIPATILGTDLASRNRWKQAVNTYTNAAGIEVGSGYFGPNIPPACALIFECHIPDGRVEYERPIGRGEAGQFRVSTLVGQIGQTDYERWRNALIELLGRSIWQRHPDAEWIRAFFGTLAPPTIAEYRAGKRERTFTCLHVYDMRGDSHTKGIRAR